jgi:magnesium-transporting ATPase (P-type)
MALNLHRAMAFCLPVNGGQSFTILLSALMGLELPITALQVLWLNMVNSRSMAVQTLVLLRVAYLISLSEVAQHLPWHWGRLAVALWRSPPLLLGLVAALVLQVLFSQWGLMNTFFGTAFGTAPLTMQQWLQCSLAIMLMIPVAHAANRLDALVPPTQQFGSPPLLMVDSNFTTTSPQEPAEKRRW